MARKINIMLILVLGVTPSWGQNFLNISDPTDVDYQNIINPSAPQSPKPIAITDISEAMLLQPDEYQGAPEHQGHLAVLTLAPDQKANRHKYGLDAIPPKSNRKSEPKKQYAWYMEDRLWLERETNYARADAGVFTNAQRSCRPGTYVKFSHSLVQNLNFSIRMVADHYWVVAGPR